MAGHFLGHFDPSTVVELIRNPRGTEGVAPMGVSMAAARAGRRIIRYTSVLQTAWSESLPVLSTTERKSGALRS